MTNNIYEMQKKKWMLEPRNADGVLDAKAYGSIPDIHHLLPCATEDELFAHYFLHNKGKESASWADLRTFYIDKYNHIIREKTW